MKAVRTSLPCADRLPHGMGSSSGRLAVADSSNASRIIFEPRETFLTNALKGLILRGSCCLPGSNSRQRRGWKINRKRSALAHLGMQVQSAFGFLDQPLHNIQPQARALPRPFRGKIGLENLGQKLR